MGTLNWKEGEGYDIHLLRGGAASKRLAGALDIPASAPATSISFYPHVLGGTSDHGIELDAQAGVVRALAHSPSSSFPRVNNFRLEATYAPPGASDYSRTDIRVHVHDAVNEIRLTPSTLTLREGSPDQYRFTVLAQFSDEVVGDITDWTAPQLTLTSSTGAVELLPGGGLKAAALGNSQITATLSLAGGITKTATATVVVGKSWTDLAEDSIVKFLAGKVTPKPDDPDSVKSVIDGATNIVLIAEGFRQPLRGDFNNLAKVIVEELRTKPYLQPFNLLKNSINYWSVFTPSEDEEEGVTLLGDYTTGESLTTVTVVGEPPPEKIGEPVAAPAKPSPMAAAWSAPEMIHEVGLPLRGEVGLLNYSELLDRWVRLFGDHVTEDRTLLAFFDWMDLAFRTPLNERNTVFGMAVGRRARASPEWGDLKRDFRRASIDSILSFVQSLRFGGHPIGGTWAKGQKDFGLVAFVCNSDIEAGNAMGASGYLTASLGRRWHVKLQAASGWKLDFKTSEPRTHARKVLASVLAHECGHVLGLKDEYGDGEGTSLVDSSTVAAHSNVQAKSAIASMSGGTTDFNFLFIKWRWPRLHKAGIATGTPIPSPPGLRVALRAGHGKAFKLGDVVRFREWPVSGIAELDPFDLFHRGSGTVLKVIAADEDGVTLHLIDGDGDVVDVTASPSGAGLLARFLPGTTYALVSPLVEAGVEQRLVAEPVRAHIEILNGPLNADAGAACVAASSDGRSTMTPRDLPRLAKSPRNKADIIGIYEGGWYHDCGVYRPAGRCKMRTSDFKTIPFCHVCRYLIVDRVDPTKHGDLDKLYPKVEA